MTVFWQTRYVGILSVAIELYFCYMHVNIQFIIWVILFHSLREKHQTDFCRQWKILKSVIPFISAFSLFLTIPLCFCFGGYLCVCFSVDCRDYGVRLQLITMCLQLISWVHLTHILGTLQYNSIPSSFVLLLSFISTL